MINHRLEGLALEIQGGKRGVQNDKGELWASQGRTKRPGYR